jgi:hypothetical protein
MRCLPLLFAVPLLVSSSAHAQAARGVQERAAKKACLVGDTAKGVEILADLYVDSNDPTYIFNQGRCFEQNRLYEDAIARFREYLVKAKRASPEDQADAEKHIAACQTYLAEAEAAKAASPPVAQPEPTLPPFAGLPGNAPPAGPVVGVAPAPLPTKVASPHNRRTPGTIWLAIGGGTGGVYHGRQSVDSRARNPNTEAPIPVAAGFASASLFQLEPELGIQVSERFALAFMVRYQHSTKDDSGYTPRVGEKEILTSATAAFLRAELDVLQLGSFRSYLSAGAGLGRSFLAVVGKDCDMTSCPLPHSDTLSGGSLGLLAGLGAEYHLTRNLGVFFDVKEIVTFRTVLALTELNVGLAVSFDPW